jgi:hypothetical protein
MYNEIQGQWKYQAAASGTFTIPAGARVLQIVASATGAATLTIFGGASIVIGAGETKELRFLHALCVPQPGSSTIVATGTDSVFIEYVAPGSSI